MCTQTAYWALWDRGRGQTYRKASPVLPNTISRVRAAEGSCQEGEGGELPGGMNTPLPGGQNLASACPALLELKGWDFISDSLYPNAYFE